MVGLERGPEKLILPEMVKIKSFKKIVQSLWKQEYSGNRNTLRLKSSLVKNADPVRQLSRGYSILRNDRGAIIRETAVVGIGETVTTEISDGFIKSEVTSTKEKK